MQRARFINPIRTVLLLLVLLGLFSWNQLDENEAPQATNATTAGKFIVEPPTLICAGFEWGISGDENRNARVSVSYRPEGTTQWKDGLPLLRIGGEKVYGHEQRWIYTTPDMFAGSIFDLEPGQNYQCRFQLHDPDGVQGKSEELVVITTKEEPKPFEEGKVYHVYPPDYQGSKESPSYTGLNEAYYGLGNHGDWWLVPDPRVQPGDIILIHAGIYQGDRLDYVDPLALNFHGAYVLTQKGTREKPIVIKAAGDGEVIFDGGGAYRLFDVMAADYHYFEGLTIRNIDIAFYAGLKRVMGCSGLTVKNCKIEDVGIAVMTHNSTSKDFYIADNVILGRHDPDTLMGWYGFENPAPLTSYYAIKVYGQSHVICHNYIAFFHDGICVDTHGLPEQEQAKKCVSIDIYGNDIFNVSDDFIEADGGVHNIRVFNNRGFNAYHAALSAQPVFGGPAYFIRNVLYNIPSISLKFMVRTSGLVVYHNTICAETSLPSFSNGHFRNNLFLGHDDNRPSLSASTATNYTSFDYNGYRKKKGEQAGFRLRYPTEPEMNHSDLKDLPRLEMKDLKEFSRQTGYEKHGVEVDYDDLENVLIPDPQTKGRVYPIDGYDFRLRKSSIAIDAGAVLPNITDGYHGKAPDLGAIEFGEEMPRYGPRGIEQMNK